MRSGAGLGGWAPTEERPSSGAALCVAALRPGPQARGRAASVERFAPGAKRRGVPRE